MEIKTKLSPDDAFIPAMYKRFIKETNPSMCATGTFNITPLYKLKKKYPLNAMLCFCIQQAAQSLPAFHYSIKEDGLYFYKNVKTNSVVIGTDGNHYYPDYSYHPSFQDYLAEYTKNNHHCQTTCTHLRVDTGALISTSAIINFPFQSFTLSNSDTFWDNFLLWGKFTKKGLKTHLNITLRFHHALIDGQTAGEFFNKLQDCINTFNPNKS